MRYFVTTLLIMTLVFAIGCSDEEEKTVGANLINKTGEIKTPDPYYSTGDTYYHTEKHIGNPDKFSNYSNFSNSRAPNLFLGQWKDISARTLLKFEEVTTIEDSVTRIGEAKIKLVKKDELGDGEIQISVHEITSDWDGTFTNWKYAGDDTLWNTPGGDYDEDPLATVDFMPSSEDTIVDTLEIVIPEEKSQLILEWINADEDTSDSYHNYGVMLIADDANSMKVFHSKYTLDTEYHPILVFDYFYMQDGVEQTTEGEMWIKSPEGGTSTYISQKPFEEPTGNETYLQISNGFYIRGLMKFDISDIPVASTANSAELTLTLLSDQEELFYEEINLQAYALKESWEEGNVNLEEPEFYILDYPVYTNVSVEDSVITLNITPWIQHWINNPDENYGLLLRSGSENQNFSSFKFYSSEAEEGKRPVLDIIYSLPPEYYW